MSPLLSHTGFGLSSDHRYSAMHVFPADEHMSACYANPTLLQAWYLILYPRWGYMPVEYFAGPHVAWSVSLRGDRFNADAVTAADISVRPADAGNNPTGPALSIVYFERSEDNYGCQHTVLIFRPAGIDVMPGSRYRVAISGLTGPSGSATPIDYWVEFFSAGVSTLP
jgi:hypothetical protein